MLQNYKIFLNDKVIYISHMEFDMHGAYYYNGNNPAIDIYNIKNNIIIIRDNNIEKLWNDFKSKFYYIEAAGGIVRNIDNKVLFIKRFNRWDLPKGKVEVGEEILCTAVREIKEETGVDKISTNRFVGVTYHIYKKDNEEVAVLKKTYWYEFITLYNSDYVLHPQFEENIIEARWFDRENIEKIVLHNTYQSLKEMLINYIDSLQK